ncbi:MAG: thioredoxin [Candidatus Margulisiibacteriota bacterium]
MPLSVTDMTFDAEVLGEKDRAVLVDFWAAWCGPCRQLAPIIESIGKKHSGKLKVCKLDTDENQNTALKYNITGIPCCIVFKGGQEIGRIVGFRPEAGFEAEIRKFVAL